MKNIIYYALTLLLGVFIVVVAVTAFYFSDNNLLIAISTATFMYTISKPIQSNLEEKLLPKDVLRVCAIYEPKESNFEREINKKIDELGQSRKIIDKIDILSTKRAVIHYREKKSK